MRPTLVISDSKKSTESCCIQCYFMRRPTLVPLTIHCNFVAFDIILWGDQLQWLRWFHYSSIAFDIFCEKTHFIGSNDSTVILLYLTLFYKEIHFLWLRWFHWLSVHLALFYEETRFFNTLMNAYSFQRIPHHQWLYPSLKHLYWHSHTQISNILIHYHSLLLLLQESIPLPAGCNWCG